MSEFNLSKKRKGCLDKRLSSKEGFYYRYEEEDVKEFIRRLKEETNDKDWFNARDIACFHRIIDKLAGEELSKEQEK